MANWFQIGTGWRAPSRWPYGAGYPRELHQAMRGMGQAPGYQVGYHGYDIGADAHMALPPGPQGPSVIDPNYLTNQPGAYQRDPSELREFFIGFDSISDVGPGAAVAISTTLQNPFRGKRLVVDPTIASSFLLQSIIVGVTPQAAAVTNTPCSTFVPESLVPLSLDTGQVGQQITLNVINRSAAPLRFLAGMTGDVLR
jgi:hypothetical protein